MEAVGFYIVYGFAWVFTLLPFPVLYIFSDCIFPLMYYFPGYRRKVVRANLMNSFPDKSIKEIIKIEKAFYHHLCDLFIETFKLIHMSNQETLERFHMTNPELLDRMYDEGRDVAVVLGHFGNWEWLVCLPLYTKLQTVSIYKPLRNKHFDTFMNNLRSKNNMILSPMSSIIRDVVSLRQKNVRSLFAFITDQRPPKEEIKFWTKFLKQDTPVYLGAEKIASKYNMAVVFFNIQNVRRGYYTLTAELLFENSKGLPEHLITETHVRRLEEIIRETPEQWIWSHRRWKHKKEQSNG
ncbi:MAG TPA: lysophospholipid acyltransferase family protein [Bacteroidales bacterium]|nr:lysophospholipid acyltransferase family protein [Bacteroidales bacterium]